MKKVSQRRKKIERGDPLGFSIPSLSQNSEKLKERPFGEIFSEKKSRNAEKTERGTLWSRPALYVTRETFLVLFPGPTGEI